MGSWAIVPTPVQKAVGSISRAARGHDGAGDQHGEFGVGQPEGDLDGCADLGGVFSIH